MRLVCMTYMRLKRTPCLWHATECQRRTRAPRRRPRWLAQGQPYRRRPLLSDCWHGFCSRGRQSCTAAVQPQTYHRGGEGMQVREIMATDIESVDRNDNLRTVEDRMATKQLRHLPVLEQGEVVGMVTQRDLFKA